MIDIRFPLNAKPVLDRVRKKAEAAGRSLEEEALDILTVAVEEGL